MTILDLTQTIDENTPVWPGAKHLCCHLRHSYTDGCLVYAYELEAGCGTHIDAPVHFIPHGRSVEQLNLDELIVPGCVLDISQQAMLNNDYLLSVADIQAWEAKHGPIPVGCVVLAYTCWAIHWQNEANYRGTDAAEDLHFPAFSSAAAKLLLQREIVGIGIDTLSPDTGVNGQFPVHELILGADKYIIENLTNLDKLPAVGAKIAVLPLKIKAAAEAPARVPHFYDQAIKANHYSKKGAKFVIFG